MSAAKLKAVIFDLDGTVMANAINARPGRRVIEAIAAVQQRGLTLSCATGRNNVVAKHITDALGLKYPCVVGAGSQIIDPKTGKELWSAVMSKETVGYCLGVLADYDLRVLVDGDSHDTAKSADQIEVRPYRMLDVQRVRNEDLPEILELLGKDASVALVIVHSADAGYSFLHVTDKLATKEYAVIKLQEMLGVGKEEMAGVGDGLNDLELFKSVGVKVAMGNAVQELKDAADLVIDTVDNDGLAKYLESL